MIVLLFSLMKIIIVPSMKNIELFQTYLMDCRIITSFCLYLDMDGFLFIYKKMVTFIKMKITILYYEYNITINVDIFYLFCWDCKVHIVRTFLVLFLVLHFVIRIFSSTLNIGVLAWIYWNLPKFGQTMQKYWGVIPRAAKTFLCRCTYYL